jgi:dipeptidyl aminopeptidase/acylaminoacyl peptidase
MRRFTLAVFAVIAFALPGFTQAKHPFTFEDMMKLKRVGEPEVSPDGKWVIFSVVDVDLAANTKTPHIWVVPAAGGNEREIIADQDADRPRWAPDGKRFAFISTKEGGSQVWIADFNGTAGTVERIFKFTSIATEASGELWSPDGKNILFTSDVYPECDGQGDEIACNAKRLDEANKSKVKAQLFTHLLYRHWNAYKEGKRSHIFIDPIFEIPPAEGSVGDHSASIPRDLTPGDYDAPVFSLGGQDNYAFSPDGQEICYTSNHDKNPAASTNNDLWIVPVHVETAASAVQVSAQTKNITADNPASDSTPLYSPDGRYISYRAQQRPGYEADRFRLMLYDRKTGEKKNLTEDFDAWVGSYIWRPDSKVIYFTFDNEGRSFLDAIYLSSAAQLPTVLDQARGALAEQLGQHLSIEPVASGYLDSPATADGKLIFLDGMSLTSPNEIVSVRADHAHTGSGSCVDTCYMRPQAVTHANDQVLSNVVMSPLERFYFNGAEKKIVEGFLVKPPNFDAGKKYPVKFLIHGGPQGAWGDDWSYRWNPELFASPTSSTSSGYVVIMINFHGSTGYGQKFIDAINGDWGGAPFEDLMKGLDYAEEHYGFIDKTRECALGASYGGYMANWILGHTDRFKCIVTHDGMFNAESAWGTTEELWFNDWEFKGTPYDNRASYEKWSPHQYAKNFKTPTLVIHGQRDYRLDVSEGLQLFTTLQMEGVPSEMLYFPDEGHWVQKPQNSQLWYKTVNDWVDRWTKK